MFFGIEVRGRTKRACCMLHVVKFELSASHATHISKCAIPTAKHILEMHQSVSHWHTTYLRRLHATWPRYEFCSAPKLKTTGLAEMTSKLDFQGFSILITKPLGFFDVFRRLLTSALRFSELIHVYRWLFLPGWRMSTRNSHVNKAWMDTAHCCGLVMST